MTDTYTDLELAGMVDRTTDLAQEHIVAVAAMSPEGAALVAKMHELESDEFQQTGLHLAKLDVIDYWNDRLQDKIRKLGPVPGMPCTIYIGSDLYPGTVVSVTREQRRIEVRLDHHPDATIEVYNRTKAGHYGSGKRRHRVLLGVRRMRRDPDF